jgi:hypothetical protein
MLATAASLEPCLNPVLSCTLEYWRYEKLMMMMMLLWLFELDAVAGVLLWSCREIIGVSRMDLTSHNQQLSS